MSQECCIDLGDGRKAVIDAADFDLVKSYNWRYVAPGPKHVNGTGYARASVTIERGHSAYVLLHRLIAGATKGQVVAFKDKDGLNCTRANLSIGNWSGVNRNAALRRDSQTRVRNVQVDKERGGFIAIVRHEGVRHRQRFSTIEAADQWARQRRQDLEAHGC